MSKKLIYEFKVDKNHGTGFLFSLPGLIMREARRCLPKMVWLVVVLVVNIFMIIVT